MSSIQFGDAQQPVEALPAVPLQPLQSPGPAAPAPEVAPPVADEPVLAVPVGDMRDVPLGTLVFRAGLLPEEHLEVALQEGMRTGKRLGEILLERRWVSETDLGRLLAAQKGLPFVELDPFTIDPTAPPLLHPEKARLHGALPIGFEGGVPVVAVADPSNGLVVENVRRALACEPVLVVAGRDALMRAINEVYGAEAPVPAAPESAVAEPVVTAPAVQPQAAPVVEPQPALVVEPQPVVEQPVAVEIAAEPSVSAAPFAPAMPVEPVTPAEPVAPVLPPPVVEPAASEPVENGDSVWLGQPEEASVPAAVAPQPVAEVLAPEPPVVETVAPVVPTAPAPVEAFQPVEPQAHAVADPGPEPGMDLTWTVVLRLADGEWVEVGAFPGEAEAVEGARAVVAQIESEGSWPFVAGRFIRPEGIVSVDLVELEVTRWLGSQARAEALGSQEPSN